MNPILPAILTMNHTQSWHLGFLDKKFRTYWITSKITPLQLLVIKHKLSTSRQCLEGDILNTIINQYIYVLHRFLYTHFPRRARTGKVSD
jgi:hypothetical protein